MFLPFRASWQKVIRPSTSFPPPPLFIPYDVLDMLASGIGEKEILEDYSFLEPEDIRACLEFAAEPANYGWAIGDGRNLPPAASHHLGLVEFSRLESKT